MASDDLTVAEVLQQALNNQTTMLRDEFQALRSEMAATRKQVIWLVALALILMAGMVGVSVTWSGTTLTTHAAGSAVIDDPQPHPVTAGFGDAWAGPPQVENDPEAVAPAPSYVPPQEAP